MKRLAALLPEGCNPTNEAVQNAALTILETAAVATSRAELAFIEASRVLADCHAQLAELENGMASPDIHLSPLKPGLQLLVSHGNETIAITAAGQYDPSYRSFYANLNVLRTSPSVMACTDYPVNVDNMAVVTGDADFIFDRNTNDISSWYTLWKKYVGLECVQNSSLNRSGSDYSLSENQHTLSNDRSKNEPPPPSFLSSRFIMFPPFGHDGVMETEPSYGQLLAREVSGAVSSSTANGNALTSAPDTFGTPYPLSHHGSALTVIDPHPVRYKHYVVLVGREPGVFRGHQGIKSNVDGILDSVVQEFDEAPAAYEVYLQALRAKEVLRVTDSDGLSYEVVEDEELEREDFDRQNLDD